MAQLCLTICYSPHFPTHILLLAIYCIRDTQYIKYMYLPSQNLLLYFSVIHIVSLALYIVCTSLSIQGECDRLSCRVQMLESELSDKTARCVGLEKQCDEEADNCRLIEVCTVSMLNCVLPNACTCRPETAKELMIGRQSVRFYAKLHNNCHTKLTHVGRVQSKQHGSAQAKRNLHVPPLTKVMFQEWTFGMNVNPYPCCSTVCEMFITNHSEARHITAHDPSTITHVVSVTSERRLNKKLRAWPNT